MSRPVLPRQLVKLSADLPRKSMRRLTCMTPEPPGAIETYRISYEKTRRNRDKYYFFTETGWLPYS